MKANLFTAALAGSLLLGCSTDRVAGKTTTTTNGLAVVLTDGTPVARFHIRYSDQPLTAQGLALSHADLNGMAGRVDSLTHATWTLAQAEDSSGEYVAIVQDLKVGDSLRTITLQPAVHLQGHLDGYALSDSAGVATLGVAYSFLTAVADSTGSLSFSGALPAGQYQILGMLPDSGSQDSVQAWGSLAVSADSLAYVARGAGVLLQADTVKPSTLQPKTKPTIRWIDDFNDGDITPLHGVFYNSPSWHTYSRDWTFKIPASTSTTDLKATMVHDSIRNSGIYQATGVCNSAQSWLSLSTWLNGRDSVDVSATDSICVSYWADNGIKLEFFRNVILPDSIHPRFYQTLPGRSHWTDTCLAIASFSVDTLNPVGMQTWKDFAKGLHSFQILAHAHDTLMRLDDIYLK